MTTSSQSLRPEYSANGNLHIAVIEFSYPPIKGDASLKRQYASIVRETEGEIDKDLENIESLAGHFEVHRRYAGINQDGRREITGILDTAKLRGKAINFQSLDAILLNPSYKPSGSVTVLRIG